MNQIFRYKGEDNKPSENQNLENYNLNNAEFGDFSKSVNSIKALAILSVILGHLLKPPKELGFKKFIFWYPGVVGLNVFVFLSGMLLTMSLLRQPPNDRSWLKWYKKRLIRIYPLLVISTFFTVLVIFIIYERTFTIDAILTHISGLQSTPLGNNLNFFLVQPHHWYITLILTCYVLFPFFFYLIKKQSKLMLILSISGYIIYYFFFEDIPIKILSITYIPRFFIFFYGMLLGYWVGKNNMKNLKFFKKNQKLELFLFFLFIFGCIISYFYYYFEILQRLFVLPLLAFVFLLLMVYFFNNKSKVNKTLGYIATESYEIYMLHYIIMIFIYELEISLNGPDVLWLIFIPLILIFSILLACPFYYLNKKINQTRKSHKYLILMFLSLILYGIIVNLLFVFKIPRFDSNEAIIGFGIIIEVVLALFLFIKIKRDTSNEKKISLTIH
ncbi:MAG: acyltransferase family protein [Candidatus Thorarchaeota archaeon]